MEGDKGEVTFNQAKLQQIRIDARFIEIDRLSVNMFTYNDLYHTDNYNVIFQGLVDIFLTISYNLNPEERKELDDKRKATRNILRNNPPFRTHKLLSNNNYPVTNFNTKNMDIINDALFDYRMLIEGMLGKYGFSNPTKQDASRSAVKF